MPYSSRFRKLAILAVISLVLFYAAVIGTAFIADRYGIDGSTTRLFLGMVAAAPLVLFLVAHDRFLRSIDEYLRGHHLMALAQTFGFALIFIAIMGSREMYGVGGEDEASASSFLASLPIALIMFYLLTCWMAVRRDAVSHTAGKEA